MTEDYAARAKRRAKQLSERAIIDWTTGALGGMLRYMEQYLNTGDEANLAEISMNLGTFHIFLDELILRKAARNEESDNR